MKGKLDVPVKIKGQRIQNTVYYLCLSSRFQYVSFLSNDDRSFCHHSSHDVPNSNTSRFCLVDYVWNPALRSASTAITCGSIFCISAPWVHS